MKKQILIPITILAFFGCESEKINPENQIQCQTDVYVNKQEDLDNFNCNTVKGDLYIGNSGYESLEIKERHFKTLEQVERSIYLSNVVNIEPNSFANLTKVGLDLNIVKNSNLESINGFKNLIQVNLLNIGGNDKLTSIKAFDNSGLTIIERLSLYENNSLKILYGFDTLKELGGLFISRNNSMEVIDGFNELTKIYNSAIDISYNDALIQIDGFANLIEIKSTTLPKIGLSINNNMKLNCENLCVFYGKVADDSEYQISNNLCKSYEDLEDTCESYLKY